MAHPPILLIHGAGGSHLDWPGVLRRIPGRRVLTIDLPGHGKSVGPGRDTVADYAADVVRLLDGLSVPRVIAEGQSMGGAITLQLGLSYPDQVAGLILVGTGARLRVHPDILDKILADPEATMARIIAWEYAPETSQDWRDRGLQRLRMVDPAVIHGDYDACNHFNVMDQLGAIITPALVIVGAADQMTPVKYGEYLAQHLPHARLSVIGHAGHMVSLEQSAAVLAAIQEWFSNL